MYRVKEINSVYNSHFGEGKGWIFVTNEVSFLEGLLFILYQKKVMGSYLSYEIIPMNQKQLSA